MRDIGLFFFYSFSRACLSVSFPRSLRAPRGGRGFLQRRARVALLFPRQFLCEITKRGGGRRGAIRAPEQPGKGGPTRRGGTRAGPSHPDGISPPENTLHSGAFRFTPPHTTIFPGTPVRCFLTVVRRCVCIQQAGGGLWAAVPSRSGSWSSGVRAWAPLYSARSQQRMSACGFLWCPPLPLPLPLELPVLRALLRAPPSLHSFLVSSPYPFFFPGLLNKWCSSRTLLAGRYPFLHAFWSPPAPPPLPSFPLRHAHFAQSIYKRLGLS